MKIYKVDVDVLLKDSIVVHATSEEEARRVAIECMWRRLRYEPFRMPEPEGSARFELKDGFACFDLSEAVKKGIAGSVFGASAEESSTDERADTYVCSECNHSAPRRSFGPGWITCPKCGGRPLPIS